VSAHSIIIKSGNVCQTGIVSEHVQRMKTSGVGKTPGKLIEEMREVRSLDVLLPARDNAIKLRVASTPSKELKVVLQRMKYCCQINPILHAINGGGGGN
jgi:hypothetical protein